MNRHTFIKGMEKASYDAFNQSLNEFERRYESDPEFKAAVDVMRENASLSEPTRVFFKGFDD